MRGNATVCVLFLTLGGMAACGPAPRAVCQQRAAAGKPAGHAKQCGPSEDFVDVHAYRGPVAAVEDVEDAVTLIDGACTGTLVAAAAGPVVLTAGHCVSAGAAPLLVFEHEQAPDGALLITQATIVERSDAPDYALLAPDVMPVAAPVRLTTVATERLAVIQHPRGRPKVIAEGTYVAACDGVIHYAGLDTLVGSSGAAVLTEQGRVLAVHSDGDCSAQGGTNYGSTIASIEAASAYLVAEDLHAPD